MARTLALSFARPTAWFDLGRSLVGETLASVPVLACALALILAGRYLPL